MEYSSSNILMFLSTYISNIGESARWLPIMALVYLLFEAPSLALFWQKSPRHPRQESNLQRCNQRLLAAYRRRTISAILIGLLSGAFIMLSLLCQRLLHPEPDFSAIGCKQWLTGLIELLGFRFHFF